MGYDYHGKWDKRTGHNAPLRPRPDETGGNLFLNLEYTVNYLLKLGAKPEKTVLGVPLYGRSFPLQNKANNGMGAAARSTSFAGPITRASTLNLLRNVPGLGSTWRWCQMPATTSMPTKLRSSTML